MPEQRNSPQKPLSTQDNLAHSLILHRANGDQITLTESNLEKWLARVQLSLDGTNHELTPQEIDASTPSLATKFLSLYGLKRPLDVIRYLKSPEGKAALTMIIEQLAEKLATIDQIRQNLTEQQRMEDRRLGCLLLGVAFKGEEQVARRNLEAQRNVDKQLKATSNSTQTSTSSYTPPINQRTVFEGRLTAYNESIKAMEGRLDSKVVESISIEEELAQIVQYIEQAEKQQALFHAHLDEIEQFLIEPHTRIDHIHERINQISALLATEVDDIVGRIEAGDTESARERMAIHHARNMQLNAFNEVFHASKKIVHHNGKYLLLLKDQKAEDLSQEDEKTAEKAYLNLRPQILSLRQLVLQSHLLEQKSHNERKERLHARSELMRVEVAFLASQLTKMQAARASIEAFMRAPNPNMTKPPVATPTSTPQANTTGLAHSYKQMVLKMYSAPLEQSSIDWLKTRMANTNTPKSIIDRVNQLRPGMPIPPSLLKELLKHREVGTTWMNLNSPDVVKNNLTPYAKPAPAPASTPTKTPEPTPVVTTAPTPLPTKQKPTHY